MNDENLIRPENLTSRELRERAKKGGKASVESRRRKKALKSLMNDLLSSGIVNDEIYKLVWSTPYARYLYHGVLMVDPKTGSAWAREGQTKVKVSPEVRLKFDKRKNPKAGSHWCERAQADHGEEWRQIYETALRKELNK